MKIFDNHRICETCWTSGPGVDDVGTILTPTQVTDVEPAPCCLCGELVIISGIYLRGRSAEMLCKGDHAKPWPWSNVRTRPSAFHVPTDG